MNEGWADVPLPVTCSNKNKFAWGISARLKGLFWRCMAAWDEPVASSSFASSSSFPWRPRRPPTSRRPRSRWWRAQSRSRGRRRSTENTRRRRARTLRTGRGRPPPSDCGAGGPPQGPCFERERGICQRHANVILYSFGFL